MNKKAIQMSLNAIIMMVLAMVFLGLAITLVYKWMPKEMPTIPSTCEIYPPRADNPVCINKEIKIKRGATVNLEVAFFNDEDTDITSDQLPTITCGNSIAGDVLALTTSTTGKDISIGDYDDFIVLVNVPSDAARDTYPCTLALSNTQESFVLKVE